MEKVLNFGRTVRTHWKKSTFAVSLVGYGVNYAHEQNQIDNMMREFCEEAAVLGDSPAGLEQNHQQISVILNPAANGRRAKKNFEKYCAPLLHLSGAYVTILETTHEGHAKKISEELNPKTTAIVVAGGDGTLSETVTSLMRSQSETVNVPIGIIPLGKYNTLATYLFGNDLSQVERIAQATMSVIRARTKKLNTYRVETLQSEDEKVAGGEKAVYGVGWIELGTWPWLKKEIKKLWYYGLLKKHVALLSNLPDSMLNASISANVAYTAPCSGCSKCYMYRPDLNATEQKSLSANSSRWWSAFVKKPSATSNNIDYKSILNERCDTIEHETIHSTDIRLSTELYHSADTPSQIPSLHLCIGPEKRYQGHLLREGLNYLNNKPVSYSHVILAKQIEIKPTRTSHYTKSQNEESDEDNVLLIDNEEFDMRPIRVTVLPNSLTVYCQ